jgi:hypothetical protein
MSLSRQAFNLASPVRRPGTHDQRKRPARARRSRRGGLAAPALAVSILLLSNPVAAQAAPVRSSDGALAVARVSASRTGPTPTLQSVVILRESLYLWLDSCSEAASTGDPADEMTCIGEHAAAENAIRLQMYVGGRAVRQPFLYILDQLSWAVTLTSMTDYDGGWPPAVLNWFDLYLKYAIAALGQR